MPEAAALVTGTVLITDHAWESVARERSVLEASGLTVVEAPSADEDTLAALAPGSDAIMTCFAPVTKRIIDSAPNLKVVARYGIGVDNIDVTAATARGVVVTNVPDYCVDEVAEHALALLLACTRGVARYNQAIRMGHWSLAAVSPLFRIKGRVLGLVGFGRIGRRLLEKVRGLGLEVIVSDPHLDSGVAQALAVTCVDFETLLTRADLVSVHAPLTPETRHLFNESALRKMKPTAVLVNTSRGELVDTVALARALRERWITAAGLDVLPHEPPDPDDPLLSLENVVLTPHAAFYSEESLAALQERTAGTVAAVLRGEPVEHLVNRGELVRRGVVLPG